MTEQAAAARIAAASLAEGTETAARAEAGRVRLEAGARAEAVRAVGAAEADAEAARVEAVTGLDTSALVALTVRDLADHLPDIGALTITPDVLTEAVARLVRPGNAS